jgi:hypothetical protein
MVSSSPPTSLNFKTKHRHYFKYNTHYKQVMCTKHSKSERYREACKLLSSTNDNTLQVPNFSKQMCNFKATSSNTAMPQQIYNFKHMQKNKLLYTVRQQRELTFRTRKCITYICIYCNLIHLSLERTSILTATIFHISQIITTPIT